MASKKVERRYFDAVFVNYDVSPEAVTACEQPDFLVKTSTHTLGVEITELYHDVAPGIHPKQAVESEQRNILQSAKRICEEKDVPPQDVNVHFASVNLPKTKRRKIVADLAEFVVKHFALPGTYARYGHFLNPLHDLPDAIATVELRGLNESATHFWHQPVGGWVNDQCYPEIHQALAKKESLLCEYLTKCDRCWLILGASWRGSSSFFECGESIRNEPISTAFERVYFVEGFTWKAYQLNVVGR